MNETQEKAARSMLANDESSTDVELFDHFTGHVGIEPGKALELINNRTAHLRGEVVAVA